MNKKTWIMTASALLLLPALAALGADKRGCGLDVLVNGCPRPEYRARGKVYVEALRDSEYSLRITNPFGRRVAVALSVDGLNTIDAKRTSPRKASKWVLGPYETVAISGWQINGKEARRFYFTGETDSYGAFLSQTEDLGVIEAVFYREKVHCRKRIQPHCEEGERQRSGSSRDKGGTSSRWGGESSKKAPSAPQAESLGELSDDYAATGIGDKVDHEVRWVKLDLERRPAATVRIRYEFRPQLVSLGVLPRPCPTPDPLMRREGASGFEGAYCPDPYSRRK